MSDNEKCVKRGQVLIIQNDPQRREEAANRSKAGAPAHSGARLPRACMPEGISNR